MTATLALEGTGLFNTMCIEAPVCSLLDGCLLGPLIKMLIIQTNFIQ